MGKLLNKDLYRSVYNNYVRHTTGPILPNGPITTTRPILPLAVNHTSFPRMVDFSHNWAKKDTRYKYQLVKYVDSPNAVTLRLPDRKRPPTYFERPLPCHMPMSGIESGPQQLNARTLR